jgi:hypothetical protein
MRFSIVPLHSFTFLSLWLALCVLRTCSALALDPWEDLYSPTDVRHWQLRFAKHALMSDVSLVFVDFRLLGD